MMVTERPAAPLFGLKHLEADLAKVIKVGGGGCGYQPIFNRTPAKERRGNRGLCFGNGAKPN